MKTYINFMEPMAGPIKFHYYCLTQKIIWRLHGYADKDLLPDRIYNFWNVGIKMCRSDVCAQTGFQLFNDGTQIGPQKK